MLLVFLDFFDEPIPDRPIKDNIRQPIRIHPLRMPLNRQQKRLSRRLGPFDALDRLIDARQFTRKPSPSRSIAW